mgnify:CR=1 FL=1
MCGGWSGVAEGRRTRNTERTRRAVLDAATQVILAKGAAVTLDQVASVAGVSKSGLIHHFGSRDQLVIAVVQDVQERFRQTVLSHLDLSENYPGKMLRAYVRALCAGSSDAGAAQDFTSAAICSVIAPSTSWAGSSVSIFDNLEQQIALAAQITLTGPTINGTDSHQVVINVPNLMYTAIPIGSDGDIITYSLSTVIFYDDTLANPWEVTVVNDQADYLTT